MHNHEVGLVAEDRSHARNLRACPGTDHPQHFDEAGAVAACMPQGSVKRSRLAGGPPALRVRLAGALATASLLAACGAPAPKDYGGAWTPVNRFQAAPAEIPLAPPYTFYASPMDGTVQTMLRRWAEDNGLQLVYQAGSDFTLYQAVSAIRTADLQAAVAQLSGIYAAQGIAVTADSRHILVQPLGTTASAKP